MRAAISISFISLEKSREQQGPIHGFPSLLTAVSPAAAPGGSALPGTYPTHTASIPALKDRRREAQEEEDTQPRSPRGAWPLLQTFALLSNTGDKVQSPNKPLWGAIRERLICSERPSPCQRASLCSAQPLTLGVKNPTLQTPPSPFPSEPSHTMHLLPHYRTGMSCFAPMLAKSIRMRDRCSQQLRYGARQTHVFHTAGFPASTGL